MHRRALLRLVPAGAAVGFAGALAGQEVAGVKDGREPPTRPRGLPPLKITDIKHDPHRPGPDPPGRRQGPDQRAGPLRPRLRHVHPAGARGADGRRQVSQALPHRPQSRRDRGHLAVVLRQLVLAERPGPVQRHERRRHGPLGHQGQAGRHAGLPAPGGQVPVRGRPLRPHQRARRPGGGGPGPRRDGEGLPARPRPARDPRHGHLRRPGRPRGPATGAGAVGPTAPGRVWEPGRYVREVPKLFEHLRAKVGDDVELLHDVHERVSPSQARPALQGPGAVPPVLRRGPAAARAERPLPAHPPAVRHADRHGRAVQHAARIRAADHRTG